MSLFPNTDWVGYENLINYIQNNKIFLIPGDFVEIGTLFGGGAAKLSKYVTQVRSYPIGEDITVNCLGW